MAKARLKEPYRGLEADIIEVLEAGLKRWRPDLEYPQSMSDMQGCVRNLMEMFEIKRRKIPVLLPYEEGE